VRPHGAYDLWQHLVNGQTFHARKVAGFGGRPQAVARTVTGPAEHSGKPRCCGAVTRP
jgi:hypothetical protein